MPREGDELEFQFPERESQMLFIIRELEKHIKDVSEKINATERENDDLMARASVLQSRLADVNKECLMRLNYTTKGCGRSLDNVHTSGKAIKEKLTDYAKLQKVINYDVISKWLEKSYTKEEPALVSDDLALSVERAVDPDSLLVGWKPSLKSVSEYKVFVNGKLHQRVYPNSLTSTRNKVLIQPVNLNESVSISLNTVYEGGDTTQTSTIDYQK